MVAACMIDLGSMHAHEFIRQPGTERYVHSKVSAQGDIYMASQGPGALEMVCIIHRMYLLNSMEVLKAHCCQCTANTGPQHQRGSMMYMRICF